MKVHELVKAIGQHPNAEVKISTELFKREPVDGLSISEPEVTICSYNLLEMVTQTANGTIILDDGDDV